MSAYYSLDAQQHTHGPFTLAEVWSLIEQGLMSATTQISTGGESEWKPLLKHSELAVRVPQHGIGRARGEGEMIACVLLTLIFPIFGLVAGIADVFKPAPRRSQGGSLLALAVIATIIGGLIIAYIEHRPVAGGPIAALTGGPKWEYKIVAPSDESFRDEMTVYGNQGWEVVSARRATSKFESSASYEMILKRAK